MKKHFNVKRTYVCERIGDGSGVNVLEDHETGGFPLAVAKWTVLSGLREYKNQRGIHMTPSERFSLAQMCYEVWSGNKNALH